ncbi:CRISPR system Cascade subunit CasC [Actinoalloteichus hoggarensis]|uniref:CRISPR system Cascade subunit CasC n=1 Tax=Actinoalloteichus hoggarensis TaxID=1470176 RepID=A0A221W6V7_9PSEU|nr:type I-E CRISPR-associated protein Cas7/Cse4/CasC [Actinoalloteichus hoggarensis]ASO21628.1 CRISPR system Cascade subunit CasC [Actinoalloteichus hoggarensis]MBB5922221.1 CRISPR system Cascade subunit CasC [Actinoalloteichus hoggarensis]
MSRPTQTPGRFIDVHVLHSVPFANLNRDDTNSVKTVQYGNTSRTRVSSQSWKRAARTEFQKRIGEQALRTRRIGEAVEAELRDARQWPADLAAKAGRHVATGSGIKTETPKDKDAAKTSTSPLLTSAMLYVPATAVQSLADLAEAHRDEITAAKDTGKTTKSVLPVTEIRDILRSRNGVINLFGRMLAEIDNSSVDGAVQVAHSFTTHTTDVEVDYFNAVDDVSSAWADETGSAHMGTIEYSAGVFYRYATVDLDDLLRNLGDDLDAARTLTAAFLDAFLLSLPQAKRTATAPHTIPDLAHLVVRRDRPISYAAAFEKPVHAARDGGHAAPSRAALDSYAKAAATLLGSRSALNSSWVSTDDVNLAHLGVRETSFDTLIDNAVTAALKAETPE